LVGVPLLHAELQVTTFALENGQPAYKATCTPYPFAFPTQFDTLTSITKALDVPTKENQDGLFRTFPVQKGIGGIGVAGVLLQNPSIRQTVGAVWQSPVGVGKPAALQAAFKVFEKKNIQNTNPIITPNCLSIYQKFTAYCNPQSNQSKSLYFNKKISIFITFTRGNKF